MPEWENWFEIAKQCKYLPENDLKVRFTFHKFLAGINFVCVCLEIVSDCMRFVD